MQYKSTSLIMTLNDAKGLKAINSRVKLGLCGRGAIVDGGFVAPKKIAASGRSQTAGTYTNPQFRAFSDSVPDVVEAIPT